jgi:hypothetical protein
MGTTQPFQRSAAVQSAQSAESALKGVHNPILLANSSLHAKSGLALPYGHVAVCAQ